MKVYKTTLQGRDYTLAIAHEKADRQKGLSSTKSLKKNTGMLFAFDSEQDITMNTSDMNYPIDMIFMDKDFKILEYNIMYPKKDITIGDAMYVLEVNAGTLPSMPGFKLNIGNEEVLEYIENIDFSDDATDDSEDIFNAKKLEVAKKVEDKEVKEEEAEIVVEESDEDKEISENIIIHRVSNDQEVEVFKRGGKVIIPKEKDLTSIAGQMQVLDDKGVVLMNIKGGERIFSRIHTDKLIALAEKVKAGNSTEEELGELMEDLVKIQDGQSPQYVYE